MFSLFEIFLAFCAWRKGWKWKALIPLSILFLTDICINYILYDPHCVIISIGLNTFYFFLDLTTCIITGIMIYVEPNK